MHREAADCNLLKSCQQRILRNRRGNEQRNALRRRLSLLRLLLLRGI